MAARWADPAPGAGRPDDRAALGRREPQGDHRPQDRSAERPPSPGPRVLRVARDPRPRRATAQAGDVLPRCLRSPVGGRERAAAAVRRPPHARRHQRDRRAGVRGPHPGPPAGLVVPLVPARRPPAPTAAGTSTATWTTPDVLPVVGPGFRDGGREERQDSDPAPIAPTLAHETLRPSTTGRARHHGLITLDASGLSRSAWYRAIDSGTIDQVHPFVARLPGTPRTPEQRIAAAVLAIGSGALASHRSAARLWGAVRPDADPVDLITPGSRHDDRPGRRRDPCHGRPEAPAATASPRDRLHEHPAHVGRSRRRGCEWRQRSGRPRVGHEARPSPGVGGHAGRSRRPRSARCRCVAPCDRCMVDRRQARRLHPGSGDGAARPPLPPSSRRRSTP